MIAKILFTTSKRIHAKFNNISVGKYEIEPMPGSFDPSMELAATNRYLLCFEFTGDEDECPNPRLEARLFLSYLGLLLGTRFQIESEMIESVQLPSSMTRRKYYPEFYELIEELPDFEILNEKLLSLEVDIARQYLRACEVYQTAVRLIEENPTLSFFLLTVSIECLSTNIITGTVIRDSKEVSKGTCDKFIEFILEYLPDKEEFLKEEDEEVWKEILKEIYYNHRSGFTHGGKKVPVAVILADMLGQEYIKNIIKDKEKKTPGLKWFESVVRKCLIAFLERNEIKEINRQTNYFTELAQEYGIVKCQVS